MKRFSFLAVLSFFLAWPVYGQEVLELKGDGIKTTKVDRVVVVKEDIILASSFPFTVIAPKGGILYQWQYPAGWDCIKKGNVLEVKSATKGMATIAVEYGLVAVDFEKKTVEVITKALQVTFAVGEVTPPDPPKPPKPAPTDPFMKRIWDAYHVETAANKKDMKDFLAAIYRERATNIPSGIANTKDLLAGMNAAWKSTFADTDFAVVRKTIFNDAKIPDGPLDLTVRELVQAEFRKIASALEYLP